MGSVHTAKNGGITLLDNDENVDLQVGDIVVQNGTRHAWNNVSDSDARVLVVMVGANRKN